MEICGNCQLPDSGEAWHKLRNEDLSDVPFDDSLSQELVTLTHGLLRASPDERMNVQQILLEPSVASLVFDRLMHQPTGMESPRLVSPTPPHQSHMDMS